MKTLFATLAVVALTLPLAPPATAQGATAAVAPARFSVEVVGIGPDVILIPGLATPREVWRPTAERLKERHRVHLIQVRGFGEPAGTNAEGPVLPSLVADLADYVRSQGISKPAIVGHSLGGLAALMLAADYPDLPGRLMIVDALPFYGVLAARPGMTITAQSIEPQARLIRDQLASTYGRALDTSAAQANAASQALSPAARATIAQWIASADPRVMGQLAYDDMTTDLREPIANISIPVTVVYPWNETYPTRAQADGFYQGEYAKLPHTKFVALGPSGHFIMLDQADAMNDAIRAFLARVPE